MPSRANGRANRSPSVGPVRTAAGVSVGACSGGLFRAVFSVRLMARLPAPGTLGHSRMRVRACNAPAGQVRARCFEFCNPSALKQRLIRGGRDAEINWNKLEVGSGGAAAPRECSRTQPGFQGLLYGRLRPGGARGEPHRGCGPQEAHGGGSAAGVEGRLCGCAGIFSFFDTRGRRPTS